MTNIIYVLRAQKSILLLKKNQTKLKQKSKPHKQKKPHISYSCMSWVEKQRSISAHQHPPRGCESMGREQGEGWLAAEKVLLLFYLHKPAFIQLGEWTTLQTPLRLGNKPISVLNWAMVREAMLNVPYHPTAEMTNASEQEEPLAFHGTFSTKSCLPTPLCSRTW